MLNCESENYIKLKVKPQFGEVRSGQIFIKSMNQFSLISLVIAYLFSGLSFKFLFALLKQFCLFAVFVKKWINK